MGAGRLGQRSRNSVQKDGAKSGERAPSRGGSDKPASKRADKGDGADRPGASGHRFGPDLACSECGILWDTPQRDPAPCQTATVRDAFARRPSGDFATPATPVLATEAKDED